jgi:MFS family permease
MLTGLAVRLALLIIKGQHYYFADTQEYDQIARAMLAGHGLPAGSPRAPLYPAFMALGYAIGGLGNFEVVRILQISLGLGIIALTGWLGARIGARRAGLVAAALVAVSPTMVFTSTMLYPTALYTTLLLLVTVLALHLSQSPSPPRAAALGAAMGLLWLTDRIAVIPIAVLFGWLGFGLMRRERRAALATSMLIALLVAIPARWVRSPKPPPGASLEVSSPFLAKAEFVLWAARHDTVAVGEHRVADPDTVFQALPLRDFLSREARYMREQPAAYAHDYAFELVHFFQPMPDRLKTVNAFTSTRARWVVAVYFLPVLVFAVVGLLAGAVSRRYRALLALVPLATAAIYALFFTQTRYRVPVEPQLTLLAGLGVMRVFEWFAPRAMLAPVPAPHAAGSSERRPA